MINNQLHFRLTERTNSHRKTGKEYALMAQFVGGSAWCIKSWERRPSEKTLLETKEVIVRSMEFYHAHLSIPNFMLDAIDA